MTKLRALVLALTILAVLAVVNGQILGKERILRKGETVLLELAPRDPRSLLQGDYMALRYRMAADVAAAAGLGSLDGRAVVELDPRGRASFVRLDDGQPLLDGQRLLVFRKRGEAVRLASDAFFFEEGRGGVYASARYGELKVARDGEAVLVGLRDKDGEPL